MNSTTLSVPDMSCGHCKAAVEAELAKLPGVRADADPERRIVEVSYEESQTSSEQLTGAIEEAGYTVTG